MLKNNLKLVIWSIIIFILSGVIWSAPLFYKGYPPQPVPDQSLPLAKNLHFTGQYFLENQGVHLAYENIGNQNVSGLGPNRLTIMIYAKIYNLFGFQPNLAQYITIFIYALINVLLFLFIRKIFDLKIGLIASGLLLFIPFFWQTALLPGTHEWATLFFFLGFIIYWFNRQAKRWWPGLFLTSILFSLAIWSRNSFIFSVAGIGLFELINKKSIKRILVLSLPIIITFLVPLIVSYFQTGSYYVNKDAYINYNHCFPDAYTYFFDKESYLTATAPNSQSDVLNCFIEHGFEAKQSQGLITYLRSLKFYLNELLRLITFGGHFIWLLMILGAIKLRKKYPEMLTLFGVWAGVWLAGLIYLKSSNSNHLTEIRLMVVVLAALGIGYLGEILGAHFKFGNFTKIKKTVWLILVSLLSLGFLIEADKWMFHEEYETAKPEQIISIVKKIEKDNLKPKDVVVVNFSDPSILNFYVNKNLIYFSPQTLEKLITENKIKEVFAYYDIDYIAGYDEQITKLILEKTSVKKIE